MYLETGASTLLDSETVPVLSSGEDGTVGDDAILLRLKTNHQIFVKEKDGTINPDAIKFTAEKINITGGTVNWLSS